MNATPTPMRVICPDRVDYATVRMHRDDRPGHETAWTGRGILQATGGVVHYGVEVERRRLRRPVFGKRHGHTWTVFVRTESGFQSTTSFTRPVGQSEACSLISHILRGHEASQ